MAFDTSYIILGAVFIGVLLMVEGLYYLYRDLRGNDTAMNRRMRMLAGGQTSETVLLRLKRGEGEGFQFKALLPGWQRFDKLVTQAGMIVSTRRLAIFAAGIGVFLTALLFTIPSPLPFVMRPILGIGSGYLMVWFFVWIKRRRRINKFQVQLLDALDLIVRSLRAGHPITTAMANVSRELNDPIGTEFGILVDETTYGMDLRDSLANMVERVPIDDLRFFVVAINVQYGTGGNLAEILEGLSKVIRERFKMQRKIKAVSAEGRMSAIVLSSLPFFVIGLINVISPTYFQSVEGDPLLPIFLGSALVLILFGIFVMWRLVQIKV
jgi:tight adherence protein B